MPVGGSASLAPEPGAWTFGASLVSTSLHIKHIEADDPGLLVPYRHDQHLLIGEASVSLARGFRGGLGARLALPLRVVRDRIRFEDLAGLPYTPPRPDTHHRNETLTRVADPTLTALVTRRPGPWTLSAGAGASIPLGRTEPNPFALGRLGLPHQHIQFGTGTWDPVLSALVARSAGEYGVSAAASARLTLYENTHGYRAGNRFGFALGATRTFGPLWGANAALSLDREAAEKWSGRIEAEGNLGRTDLFARAGVSHALAVGGSLDVSAQIPLRTWATGEQVEFPIVVSLGWTR